MISGEKKDISMGNTLKYAKLWSFCAPVRSFLRVPGEAKTLDHFFIFFLQEVSRYTKMFGTVSSIWNCQHKLVKLMADWEIQDGRKSRKFCLMKILVPVITDRNKTNCF